ncbi:MAG: hypothetical protein WCG27_05865 [Pseudomonadota bacterium]
MFRTYLPNRYHFAVLVLLALAYMVGHWAWDWIILFFYLLTFYLFRKRQSNPWDHPINIEHAFFSPINGKVVDIKNPALNPPLPGKYKAVRLRTTLFQEMGIFMPLSAEVRDLVVHLGKRLFRLWHFPKSEAKREKLEYVRLILHTWERDDIVLDFYPYFFGARPQIVLLPGDRGKKLVNIGLFPFGGQVVVYLPEKYEILVTSKDVALAGETLLAGDIEVKK